MSKISHAFFHRINVCPWVYAFVVGGFSLSANAADPAYDAFMSRVVGNATTVSFSGSGTPLVTSSSHLGTPSVSNMAVRADSAGGFRLEGRASVPLPGTKASAPVNVKVPITRVNFGKALMLAGKLAWPIGVVMASGDIYDYIKGLGVENLKNTGGEIRGEKKKPIGAWSGKDGYYDSAQAACNSHGPGSTPTASQYYPGLYDCMKLIENSGGQYGSIGNTDFQPTGQTEIEIIEQSQIEDLIAANTTGWPSSAARALATALATPGVVPITETPVVTGPATLPATKTTTSEQIKVNPGTTTQTTTDTASQPATKTTTTTQAHTISYNNNIVTNKTTTTTVINITNNITGDTTNEAPIVTETEDLQETEPEKEEKSECEKNPDALMCQKIDLDTPEGEIPKSTKNIEYQQENLFGGGGCPADVFYTPKGSPSLKVWDWTTSCGMISSYVKPVLLLLASFSAFMILIPGRA